ncbi:MAG TPA: SHOCT domain-containing protein [Luteimicrobium sp.]|nr:SHOCT domain-containing protein [Luteimicrobium sp.]
MIGRARIGRGGLIGTAARTAVIAGTATATTGAMARHQQRKMYEQQAEYSAQQTAPQPVYAEPAPAPAEPAGGGEDLYAQLQQLGQLHAQGILSDEEFAQAKAKILG